MSREVKAALVTLGIVGACIAYFFLVMRGMDWNRDLTLALSCVAAVLLIFFAVRHALSEWTEPFRFRPTPTPPINPRPRQTWSSRSAEHVVSTNINGKHTVTINGVTRDYEDLDEEERTILAEARESLRTSMDELHESMREMREEMAEMRRSFGRKR